MSAVRPDARHRPRQPEVRRQGLTRNLPGEAVGRIFGLAFALEQVRHTLGDLAERVLKLPQIRLPHARDGPENAELSHPQTARPHDIVVELGHSPTHHPECVTDTGGQQPGILSLRPCRALSIHGAMLPPAALAGKDIVCTHIMIDAFTYDEPNPSGAGRRPKRQEEPRMPRSLDHEAVEAIHVTCKRLASRISVGSKERSMSHSRSKGTALITGASAGIGAVYADRLAKRNYDLVLVARNEARLKALSGRLTSETGRSVTPLRADLGDKADLATVESMLRDDQAITMLVNNAGIAAITPLLNTDVADVADMIALNIVALTRLTYAAAPAFVARRAGTIINIASVVGLSPETLNGVYGATKAYVIALSHSLQHELADKGLRIQAVLPGATATELWATAGLPYQNLPAAIVMSPEDMVDAALVGLDQGEIVTLPSLHDGDQWTRFEAARRAIAKQFGNSTPASRYRIGVRTSA